YCLIFLSLAILAGALTFSLFQSYASSETERKAGLAYMDDIAMSVLNRYHALELSGEMTRQEAQSEAMKAIGEMRYGDGSGYFWINDMRPYMIMHPINTKLNGVDLSQNQDPNGKFLFMEFVETVKANGQGFVDYYWPKPDAKEPVEKYSHVIGFEPWGWIVGTGVYVDDLHAIFRENMITYAMIFAVCTLILLGGASFVVRSVTRPIGEVKHVLQAIADGHANVNVPHTAQKNEIGEMARALLVLRDAVEERLALQQRESEQSRALADEQIGRAHV